MIVFGIGQCFIASIFLGSVETTPLEMICPKYSILFTPNSHFYFLPNNWFFFQNLKGLSEMFHMVVFVLAIKKGCFQKNQIRQPTLGFSNPGLPSIVQIRTRLLINQEKMLNDNQLCCFYHSSFYILWRYLVNIKKCHMVLRCSFTGEINFTIWWRS